jgi:hypothetical protein
MTSKETLSFNEKVREIANAIADKKCKSHLIINMVTTTYNYIYEIIKNNFDELWNVLGEESLQEMLGVTLLDSDAYCKYRRIWIDGAELHESQGLKEIAHVRYSKDECFTSKNKELRELTKLKIILDELLK